MSYKCGKCQHLHESVLEAKICYGIVQPVRPAEAMVTRRQIDYVGILGGDEVHAATLTRKDASDYISDLKRGIGVNLPTSTPQVQQPAPNQKLIMLNGLIDSLPDGRYATRADESQAFTFFRIKRHTRGKLNGCLTIQTQHSDVLKRAGVRWRSGFWTFDRGEWIVDQVLMSCLDPKQAAYNYAQALHHCGVCGKELTDERSRWYGIGPDCETRHRDVIDWVDEQHDGKSYEQARHAVAF